MFLGYYLSEERIASLAVDRRRTVLLTEMDLPNGARARLVLPREQNSQFSVQLESQTENTKLCQFIQWAALVGPGRPSECGPGLLAHRLRVKNVRAVCENVKP